MPLIFLSCKFVCFFRRALDKCDTGLFNKLVGIYPELAAHERAVDVLIDLFKKDQVNGKLNNNYYYILGQTLKYDSIIILIS